MYAAYTDFESMPKWSKGLTAMKVTAREGDRVFLEGEELSSEGEVRRSRGVVVLVPGKSVESESESRYARTRRSVTFEDAPEGGTRVTAALDVEVKGIWRAMLKARARRREAEESATEELDSFAEYAETLGLQDP